MRILMSVTVSAGVLFACGCSSDRTGQQVAAMNKSNIQRVSNLYAAFQNFKGGRGPNDEAEFKQFISEFDPNKLKMMGVDKDNIGAIFTSERDSKPFRIRYKVGGGRGSEDAVAFEEAGMNGTKQVGYTGGRVEDVDDATYQNLFAGRGGASQPPAGPAGAGGRPSGPPAGAPSGPGGGGGGRPSGAPSGAPTGPGK